MRILQISPCRDATPPQIYGPAEQVVSDLTEELVKLGHDVTMFATGDSRTSAKLVYELPEALTQYRFEDRMKHLNAAFAYAKANTFDIIHNHDANRGIRCCLTLTTPHVTTMCWTSNEILEQYMRSLNTEAYAALKFVSISRRQREILPYFNWIETVHNGIDISSFPLREQKSTYLLFLGRIAPEKGTDIAIKLARVTGIPLIIAGYIQPQEQTFFETQIRPFVDNQLVQWIGPANQVVKRQILANAMALLMPIRWEEPFGLVMIEAMACGTPVVALNKGAVPEVVLHEKTGFVVDNFEEMKRSMDNLHKISPRDCRQHVERHFSAQRMAENYLTVYRRLQ